MILDKKKNHTDRHGGPRKNMFSFRNGYLSKFEFRETNYETPGEKGIVFVRR
jgi:hypothetical protein